MGLRIRSDFSASSAKAAATLAAVLFFPADDGIHGRELWRSTGTDSGTRLHADVVAGSGGSDLHSLTVAGPLVYFVATADEVGRELFAVPASALPAVIEIQGAAAGGAFKVSVYPSVSVVIATFSGQSATLVAANLVAAINGNVGAQSAGISARLVGSSVILVGTDAIFTTYATTDPGLSDAVPAVPEVPSTGFVAWFGLVGLLAHTCTHSVGAAACSV